MMRKRLLRHVRRYIEEVESVIGVSPEVPYHISDYTKRINWNKQKSLMRVQFAVSELLEWIFKGKHNISALQALASLSPEQPRPRQRESCFFAILGPLDIKIRWHAHGSKENRISSKR